MKGDVDSRVRLAAFQFLERQTAIHGEVLPRSLLEKGFEFEGHRVPLLGPQGIFKPAIMDLPLSFCTVPPTLRKPPPYADEVGKEGLLLYRYRGTDPEHRDNVGLRRAMQKGAPLVYLYGLVPGLYRPVWPAYVVGDNPERLTFTVAVDDRSVTPASAWVMRQGEDESRRKYVTVQIQHRMHQRSFRERVLRAYRSMCAVCLLRHAELLEAAHILPDDHPQGEPVIPNGVALCKLHHAAFDANILGIRPDYKLEIRDDVLHEHDGPMLKAGLQEVHGQALHVPRAEDFKPSKPFLEIRYEQFRKAS